MIFLLYSLIISYLKAFSSLLSPSFTILSYNIRIGLLLVLFPFWPSFLTMSFRMLEYRISISFLFFFRKSEYLFLREDTSLDLFFLYFCLNFYFCSLIFFSSSSFYYFSLSLNNYSSSSSCS